MSEPHENDKHGITVPKFSSFKTNKPLKSNPKDSLEERHHRSRRDHQRDRHDSDKSRSRHKPLDDDRNRRDRSKRSERRSLSPHGAHHRPKRAPSEPPDGAPERKRSHVSVLDDKRSIDGLYIIDTKGDVLLKKYGNNVHYHVPSTYRYPPGRVLGAEGRLYIHRDGIREEFSLLQPGERADSHRYKDELRSRWPRAHPNPLRLRPQTKLPSADEDEALSFLQIRKPKKRSLMDSDAGSSSDEAVLGYRSIEGKMKANPVSDNESEQDSDIETDIHQDNPLRWRSVQLNQQVKAHPEDIDAWLELVDHQNALLKAGHRIDQSLHEDEVHSYAEIKVSMLESALSYAHTRHDRMRVLPLLMREGAQVWDRKTAAKRWEELSEEERSGFELWRTNMDFRMSDIANFQYEDVKKLFLLRIRYLVTGAVTVDSKAHFEEAVYVFLRATRLIADAGYRELALSAWQALFELNLFRPSDLSHSSPLLELFQEFWESEVPRFGEVGAQGWRCYVDTNGVDDPVETPVARARAEEGGSRDPYKLWAALEQMRGKGARIPARTLDDGNDDDPFRVVMFSDIEHMIFSIPPDIFSELTAQLIDAFLIFSGLPPAVDSSSWTQMAMKDPYIVGGAGTLRTEPSWTHPIAEGQEGSKRPPLLKDRMLECSVTTDVLLPGQFWFQYLPNSVQDASVPWEILERALRQIAHVRNINGLGEYLLALSNLRDPSVIRKQAKALLKQYPTRTVLYIAYAQAEFTNGNDDVAHRTIASAVDISSDRDQVMALRAWGWIELEHRNRDMALRLLCSAADAELRRDVGKHAAISSSQVLKASQMFESEVHASLYAEHSEAAALYGECLMLLTYLTSTDSKEPTSSAQGGIEAAMEKMEHLSQELSQRKLRQSSGHEKLLQAAARLLYWHAENGPFRRTYLRERLTTFVEHFPKNIIFLSLIEWSDSGLRVIDETRQLLHELCLKPGEDCLSTRVFAIQHEMERGNSNSTRAAFESAVASDACRASPGIWLWYIRFCYSQKSLRPKGKDVFYRALRHCPWSKEVMMQAFTTLSRTMESHELRSVYETMTSKGLRIHVELDDFLQNHEQERAREKERR